MVNKRENEDWSDFGDHLMWASILVGAIGAGFIYGHKRSEFPSSQLKGKTMVITGATSGIGRATAEKLALKGADLVLACRDVVQGACVCDEIQAATRNNSKCEALHIDFANPNSILSFSQALGGRKVHCLVNNAGAMFAEKDKSVDVNGKPMDRSMVVNYLGPFLLTQFLKPALEMAGLTEGTNSRIVNVGSRLEKSAKLECSPSADDNLGWLTRSPEPYSTMQAYANSKLCLTSWTFEMARKLGNENSPVNCNVVTPGMVNTNLSRFMPSWMGYVSWPLRKAALRSPEKGAETVVWAASARELDNKSGEYYGDLQRIQASDAAQDEKLAKDIFTATEETLNENNCYAAKRVGPSKTWRYKPSEERPLEAILESVRRKGR